MFFRRNALTLHNIGKSLLLMNVRFSEIVFTISRYGKPAIECGKHRYNQYTSRPHGVGVWRCVKWASNNCRASLTTADNEIVKKTNAHNH